MGDLSSSTWTAVVVVVVVVHPDETLSSVMASLTRRAASSPPPRRHPSPPTPQNMRAVSDPNQTMGDPVLFVRSCVSSAARCGGAYGVGRAGPWPNREIVHSTRTRASQHVDHDPHDDEMIDEVVDLLPEHRS